MIEKNVSVLENISSFQVDTESVARAAVFSLTLDAPEEKVVDERGNEIPVGGAEQPVEEGDVCEMGAGTEAEVEEENVDFVVRVAKVGISGYAPEEFRL